MKKHLFLNQSFGTVGGSNQTGETLSRENRIGLMSYLRRTLMLLFAVLVMSIANIGMAWGTNGDVLFNQGFGSATGVAYSANTARSYSTSSTLSGLVGTGDNLFQGAQCTQKTNCGIAINTTSGANSYTTAGTFQAYANNTSFKWALYKTTNFATTAPTAIKFEMDVTPKYIDSKQALAVVVGSGFSVGTSKPAWTAGYTGFNIITYSNKTGKIYIGKVGGTTSIQTTTGMTSGTNYHITWVINATGDDLTYTGPDSKSYTLATAKWDMWVGTTRIISGQDRTKTGGTDFSGTTMQNLYIGNDVSGKHEVIIDNVKVTDLTPSCDAADLTASNITSNGDQEAGTGITFSKVGSPASGDTWYWQTSATGTDKTYNATSPYTTATTAGSYTVYLRAFNTDCWGTAASMTNTIYPAPSAMIHNTFAVNDAWSSTIATQDKTNITSLNAMAAVGESVGSGSNKSGLTQKIPSQSSEDASKYMSLSFNVASGKQLNVTSVVFDEQPVTGTGTFKVSISDNQGSATKTQTIASDAAGSKHTLTLDGDIVGSFKGTVTVKVWAYGWGDGYRFGDYFYINGTVTAAAACVAPNHVDISGNYHFFPGETLALTATAYSTAGTSDPIAAGDITGYQWQKYIGSDWENIVGETSATYTKANATTSDVGQYRCIVSTGATCSTTSDTFNAKCLQLYVYWDNKSDKCNLPFTKVDGTHATVNVSLENGSYTYYYKVTDGCGNWWGNDGTMTSGNCSGWNLNVNNHCGLTTTKAAAYTFNLTYNAGVDAFSMSVVYPSTVQPEGYNLYFANDERNWSNIHYRIGRSNWNSKAAMTLVPGTANLYQTTTIHYESDGGFEAWHIANNGGWSNGNSIYKTNTGDGNAITNATRFEGSPVPSTGLTVIPGSDHSTGGDAQNNNCEFYSYTTVPGMKTQNVAISPYSNGTITVNYTNTSGSAATLTSGNADLAHSVILTSITAVADEGYDASAITINGGAYSANYVVTGATTIAATFSPHVYTITYKDQGNVAFSGTHTDTPSAHPTSHTYNTATNLNGATKAGYTFGGWYTNSACTGDAVTSLGATDYTADITLYAKWTEEVAPTDVCWDPATTPADKLDNNTTTLTTLTSRFAAIDGVTSVTVDNPGTETGQCAGSDDGKGYLKVKNASENKIITIVTTAATNITIGGQQYSSNTGSFYLVKSTATSTKLAECNTDGVDDEATNLPAGTYYIYAKASTKSINFSKLCIELYECSTPAAPTAFANTAVTSTTATFSITDGGDAASYDLYYASGSPSTPTDGTAATENVTTKTPTITGLTASTTYKIWVRSVCDASHKSDWVALGTTSFTTAATYSVTHSLTNVTATSGATGAGAATEGVAYNAVFAANSGYVLPSTITVTIGGSPATVGTGYTWNASTGAFQVPAAQVTGAIVITIAGETAPATKDIYYGAITITAGALTRGSTGTVQFFTNTGGTIANNTEISLSTTLGAGSEYYLSNDLTGAELSKSSNWTTSSSSNRYVQGVKFGSGKSYTLALGSKVASSITFYGINGSASKTMTIGGQAWTSSSTKNTFAKHEFTKSGNFTGNVTITEDGDFYGILVITIQTATPCTTPIIPTLSNQTVCPGNDIAAWDATQTAVLADGETASYSWKKKGNDTELANTASFDLGSSAAESQAGTYVVTVTVSKAGKASSSAYREVELSVTDGIEVTGITADKATVYPTNSVTLTATASADATWQWYTCTNAEGAGEAIISGAESASYTIASAGAVGTYYYKVKATSSCGTASAVYTLTVSPAASSEDCFHFVSVIPGSNINISSGASIVTPTHATTLEGGTMKVGSQQVVITAGYGLKMEGTKTVSITLESALEAGNVVVVKGTSGSKGYGITINGVNFYDADNKTFDVSYTVLADDGLEGQTALTVSKYSGNSYLQEVKITGCGESCTDPEVTASVDNSTICVGGSVTFTAANAHASATYQWQKYSGSAWTNISGAESATYTINPVAAGDETKYRVIASHDCNRTSNEVTLNVAAAPVFGDVPSSVSVMQTIALSINTVEATDAVKYRWYKSADATWDAGDVEIGTNKELIKAYDGEAIGSPSYYIFCRAQNACGITTSTAIEVNVTTYVEEDCATRGNEGSAEFSFENSGCGQGSYQSANCWTMNSNSKILVYYPPTGKYFKTAKVTIASSSESKASYNWSTNGGTTFTEVAISSINTTLTEKTFNLSAHGNVNALQIGRNLNGKGESSGTLYVSKICFEYTDACSATTVTPSESSVNYEMDGSSFTEPTFTVKHGGTAFDPQPTLTYSSSNEDIASVDDDGTVTFNGEAGTVTITASYAGGTISATDYCASSGSYTINVSCPGGAPKVVADGSVDMSGCNSSVTLLAKTQSDGDFADGTYQWFRNGEEIDGATSSSFTATQAGTYTVERTNASDCTTPSTNSAIVTSTVTEPEVERLVPFQYYHVDKTYSAQMKMRHLFAVKNSGKLDGKSFKMYVSRNGAAATDVTSSNALVVWPNGDGHVDTVMVDLNKLSGKYSEDDELVFTCKAIDCSGNVSDVYKETITMNVIGATPTLALICSGSSKAGGTRKTGELTVGGDFLTGYNVADLCQQTGNTSFDGNTEWGLYTDLKTQYIVTPVNGYAVFNKLNYEPFDILLLTDYPKASKSDAAATILDDMAALCDYRPMLSFKTHMVAKSPSKWAAKGFTTSPVVTKADGRLNLNIVCYAHPMFEGLKTGDDVYNDVGNTSAPLVYTMLTGTGFESSKGMQGFELAAAENFVTIGLTHYNGTITKDSPLEGQVSWASGSEDRMLVTVAERQANPEARFILFSLNCGAQSKLTDKGEEVILACLNYLLGTAEGAIAPADCSFTFDNGEGNKRTPEEQAINCPSCPSAGDHKWNNPANWGPDYRLLPGEFTSVRIKKPVEVDDEHAHVMEVRIIDEGSIDIPAGKALDVKSTIRRMDGSEIYPTEENDIHIGSASTGNGTLIFNNNDGDTKARVDMYSKGKTVDGVKNYQYIGTPFNEINALYNYYGARIYSWNGSGWTNVKNGGPMTAWTGYCISSSSTSDEYYQTSGTLTATTTKDITVLAGANMVIGNSWTAPISIQDMTTDDFENLTANIYFFNTGVDKTGGGTTTENATGDARWTPGTYVSIPIASAPYTGSDDHIPSLQGFFVKSSGSAGTLHLDYERHVRKTTRDNILSGQMHAPRRAQATDTDEPVVLKMKVSGENYDDKLVLLGREDFSEGFDNGWDGDKWDGNESALYIYTTDNNGTENSVSAIPELEGTIIGFRAGEDDAYTLNFEYLNSDEPLYLYDVENNTYTQIMTGMTYRFFTTDNEKHARFIITRSNGQEVTTGVESTSGSLDRSKAKKLLIEDKMFIIVNGMLYDATGKVVK